VKGPDLDEAHSDPIPPGRFLAAQPWPAAGQAHVWQAQLVPRALAHPHLVAKLSAGGWPEEAPEIGGQRDPAWGSQAFLRAVLAAYLQTEPGAVALRVQEGGKPTLDAPANASALHFSLSHKAGMGLLAVSSSGPVGLDLERVRPFKDMARTAARVFTTGELDHWQRLDQWQKVELFYTLWTLKEACAKATGEGLARPFRQIEALAAAMAARGGRGLIVVEEAWTTWSWAAPSDCCAALAAGGRPSEVLWHGLDLRTLELRGPFAAESGLWPEALTPDPADRV
jgi:4'-phosphopantetheinyl transferase